MAFSNLVYMHHEPLIFFLSWHAQKYIQLHFSQHSKAVFI